MFMSSTLRNFDHGKTINLYRHRFQVALVARSLIRGGAYLLDFAE